MARSLSYDEYIARVTELVATGDLDGLVDHVVEHVFAYTPQGAPTTDDILGTLPRATLLQVVRALLGRTRTMARPPQWALLNLVTTLFARLPAALADEDWAL